MTCDLKCVYRQETLTSELAKTFARTSRDHLIVAVSANALVSYFFKMGEVQASCLQGAMTAFVVNLTHYLSHHLPGDEEEELRVVLVTMGMFWGSVFFFPDIAAWLGKEATFYDSLKFGVVSWTSIAVRNYFYN